MGGGALSFVSHNCDKKGEDYHGFTSQDHTQNTVEGHLFHALRTVRAILG